MEERAKSIASNLRRFREAAGLSLRELAAKAGVHHNTVLNIEQGKGSTVDSLERLAAALSLSFDDLTAVPVTSGPAASIVERFKTSRWCQMLELDTAMPLQPDEERWLMDAPVFQWLGDEGPSDKAIYLLVLARRARDEGTKHRGL